MVSRRTPPSPFRPRPASRPQAPGSQSATQTAARTAARTLASQSHPSASAPAPAVNAPETGLRRPALVGLLGAFLLIGVLGGWAGTTVIGGAIIARGEAVVDGRAKVVQHPDGGIVQTIHVENGDPVAAGAVLMTLNPDLVSADLDIARTRLAAALARRTRLDAEQTGQAELSATLPPLPEAITRQPLDLATQYERQLEIFAARAAQRAGSRDRLSKTQAQIDTQIDGINSQITALEDQLVFLTDEINVRQGLVDSGLGRQTELNTLLRERADLTGRRASLVSEIAGLETARSEAEIETEQTERAFREEVATDLGSTTTEIEELIRTIVAKQGQLDRMEIRAPAAGIVHELSVSTVGGVVTPGDTVMEIVPQDSTLEFEVQVDPAAIDQIHPGQEAELMLAAFDPQTTPRLTASVQTVSPAAVADPRTGQSFYRVELGVTHTELARLGNVVLVPGMPVEAYLATSDRTVLAYLADPLTSHIRRAFRE